MNRTHTILAAALVALSALLLALASPPVAQGWLGWLALVPFFWVMLGASRQSARGSRRSALSSRQGETPNPEPAALSGAGTHPHTHTPTHTPKPLPRHEAGAGRSPGQAHPHTPTLAHVLGVGFLHGFLFLLFLVPWFAQFSPLGYPLAAACWGLFSGVLCAVLVVLIRRVGTRWAPPLLAAGWTLLEWFHAQGALAFPWGTLAATQYRSLPVLQLLDLTGAYGLTFLMALLSASLALLLAPNLGGKEAGFRRSGAVWTCVSALLALASAGRGVWILQHPAPPGETARVAVVQASESRKVSGARVECISPFRAYEEGTRAAIREGAELVMWPESACVRDAVHDPEVDLRLKALLRGTRTHLLTGSFVQDYASGQATNAAVMRTPSGLVRGQYAKVQIVPFGEYLPLRPLLSWTERLGMPAEDLRAGDRWTPLGWRRGSVGVSICFESAFGPISRVLVDQGADLLAVLTSDGWVGRAAVGRQHAAFAPLRAVENRRSLARAAATGISELIDPYGRPLQTIPMFERGIAVADLPVRHDRTLYSRLGDWPVWLSWAILLGAACAGIWRPRERGSL